VPRSVDRAPPGRIPHAPDAVVQWVRGSGGESVYGDGFKEKLLMAGMNQFSRRDALRMGLAAGAGMFAGGFRLSAPSADVLARLKALPLVTNPIPSSGERIPVVGLGTAQSWGSTPRTELVALLQRLQELGCKVVDTAPAYGNSETALGDVVHQIGSRE